MAIPAVDKQGNLDRRSAVAKDLLGLSHSLPTEEEIDGVTYSYKKESLCKVCALPDDLRMFVDDLLLYPKTYQATLDTLSPQLEARGIEDGKRPSYNSIRNHQKRHMSPDKFMVREIVERRAEQEGLRILEGKDRLLTAKALYEVIVQKGWNQIIEGHLVPTIFETIQAQERLNLLESDADGSVDIQQLLAQLNIIISVVRAKVPPELWSDIASEIDRIRLEMGNPIDVTPKEITSNVEQDE